MRSTDNEFTTDNEDTDNVVDKDEDFLPSILIRNIFSTLSNILDVKLNNIYEVSIKANKSTICL